MNSYNKTVGGILTSQNQYVIPVFQRYYRWEQPQWAKLWEGVLGLQAPDKKGSHFMGFLVLASRNSGTIDGEAFYIIDGQQRLTTLSLALIALRNVAEASQYPDLARRIHEVYLVHPHAKGDARFRLFPKDPDRAHYIAAVTRQGTPGGRIGDALAYFQEQITASEAAKSEDGLTELLKLLTVRLEFVYATLTDDNPYNIFKSLNSTGIPLGPADLVRNFVFLHVRPEDQDEFDSLYWRPLEARFQDAKGTTDSQSLSAFFRDFLMREGAYVAPAATFETFEGKHESTEFDPRSLAATLNTLAGYFSTIRGDQPDASTAVTRALARLRELESSTTYPLLLRLFEQRANGALSDSDLAECISLLSGFIFRRFVSGEQSRGYGHLFASACKAVGDSPLAELRSFLEGRTFPEDERFKEAFIRFPLYRRGYCLAALRALDEAQNPREIPSYDGVQIEHIMPQTLTAAWRHELGEAADEVYTTWLDTPGNLTLTGKNGELSNSPYTKKLTTYRASTYALSRGLDEYERWCEKSIRHRGETLAEVAVKLWPGPVTKPQPSPTDSTPTRDLQLEYWTAFEQHVRTVGSSLLPSRPQPANWFPTLGSPRHCLTIAYANIRDHRVAASLYLQGQQHFTHFQALLEQRTEIETEAELSFEWLGDPAKKHSEIIVRRSADPRIRSQWPELHDWTRESLEVIQNVLWPRVRELTEDEDAHEDGLPAATAARYESRRRYWSAFGNYLRSRGSSVPVPAVSNRHDRTYPVQTRGLVLWTYLSRKRNQISVGLAFRGKKGRSLYEAVRPKRDVLTAELEVAAEWQEPPDTVLTLRWDNVDPTDEAAWPAQHEWLLKQLEAMYRYVLPRLEQWSRDGLDEAVMDTAPEAAPSDPEAA